MPKSRIVIYRLHESINFFGIEIEAYKIGDSLPAPSFNIVAKPNDWTRSIKVSASSTNVTETKQFQLEYWEAMKAYFEDSQTFLRFPKPCPQHWINFSLGKTNYWMSAVCSVKNPFIRIDINIAGDNAKENFNLLRNKYESESKALFGNDLIWDELPNAKQSILLFKKIIDVKNKNLWKDQHEWFRENLEKFDKYFRTKIKDF